MDPPGLGISCGAILFEGKDDFKDSSTFSDYPWFLFQDYVTEKLFEALQHNLLPVVLGKYVHIDR
jgi:hypothetical protein